MAIVNEDLTVVNETTLKVKPQSKGKNMNIFDCFWLHFSLLLLFSLLSFSLLYYYCYYYYYYYYYQPFYYVGE